MSPTTIATLMAGGGRRQTRIVAIEPDVDVVEIALLRPEQSGEGLPLDAALFLRRALRMDRVVELVGFRAAMQDELIDIAVRDPRSAVRES